MNVRLPLPTAWPFVSHLFASSSSLHLPSRVCAQYNQTARQSLPPRRRLYPDIDVALAPEPQQPPLLRVSPSIASCRDAAPRRSRCRSAPLSLQPAGSALFPSCHDLWDWDPLHPLLMALLLLLHLLPATSTSAHEPHRIRPAQPSTSA